MTLLCPSSPLPVAQAWLAEPWSLAGSYVASLLPQLQRWGLDTEASLAAVGLSSEQLRVPGFRLSFLRAWRLLKTATLTMDDPLLALRLGQCVQPRGYSVLGYAVMSATHLHEALERLADYETIVWNLGSTQLIKEGSSLHLRWQAAGAVPLPAEVVEMAISGWIHAGRQWLGVEQGLKRVCFTHVALDHSSRYREILGIEPEFHAAWNGLELAESALQQPAQHADKTLCRLMDRQAQSLLAQGAQLNMTGQVRAAIWQLLAQGEPSLDQLAENLGLGSKGLSRRLAEQGCRYVDLLDEVRRDAALIYLEAGEAQAEIALRLGFSEQSAFVRAFKRWTGTTPGRYRRSIAGAEESLPRDLC